MNDEEFIERMEETIKKMPKAYVQQTQWLMERELELYEELVGCGISTYGLVGMLEKVKTRLIEGCFQSEQLASDFKIMYDKVKRNNS